MKKPIILLFCCLSVVTVTALSPRPSLSENIPEQTYAVTLQQGVNGYSGNSNATLDSWAPNTNSGSPVATISLRPGVTVGLVRFDLSSIPTDGYVTQARLSLYPTSRSNSTPMTVTAHRLLRPWRVNQANWYQAANNDEWERVGANDIYRDRAGAPSGQVTLTSVGTFFDMDITALVRDWVRYPSTNYGMALLPSANASVLYTIAADNHSNPSLRIKLTITYRISADNDFPPAIAITNPVHNAFVTDHVQLTVNVQDDRGISQVRYTLDGTVIGTATTPPYEIIWNTSSATLGRHELRARVTDSTGQTASHAILVNVYRLDHGILTIGHITDAHIGTPWEGQPSNPDLHRQRLQQALQELNTIIKPAVIINTGDTVNITDDYSAQLYASIVATSTIPIRTIPGNHDLSNYERYLYYIGQGKQWFDLGPHRFIGFISKELDRTWLHNLLASTDKTGILYAHYLMRLPQGSTSPEWFYVMPADELAALQQEMAAFGAPAYLSGHYHQYFLLEDSVSRAVEIGGPSLGYKSAYMIVTSDNGIISNNIHYLGDWPAIVITSPQRFYSDGGSRKIWDTVAIRAKVYGPDPITRVTHAIDGIARGVMTALGSNVFQALWDTATSSTGLHSISVSATDSAGRSRQADIIVNVMRSPTPTATPTPTPTPTPTRTPLPPGNGQLQGQIQLQGRGNPPTPAWMVPLRVRLFLPGDNLPVYEFSTTTDQSGSFIVPATTTPGIWPSSYTVKVKNPQMLQNVANSLAFQNDTPTVYSFGLLRGGDANDDNRVSLADVSILASTYGKSLGQPGYDARADFTGDDRVNLADVSILAANYNRQGMNVLAEAMPQQQIADVPTPPRIGLTIVPSPSMVSSGQLVDVEYRLLVTDGTVNAVSFIGGYDPAMLAVVAVSCEQSPFPDFQTCHVADGHVQVTGATFASTTSAPDTATLLRVTFRILGSSMAETRLYLDSTEACYLGECTRGEHVAATLTINAPTPTATATWRPSPPIRTPTPGNLDAIGEY